MQNRSNCPSLSDLQVRVRVRVRMCVRVRACVRALNAAATRWRRREQAPRRDHRAAQSKKIQERVDDTWRETEGDVEAREG